VLGKHLVVSEEVEQMLVGDAEVLFFISLLVVDNEVVEKNLVEVVEVLLDADPGPLLRGLLVLIEAQLLGVLCLQNTPELLEGEAAQRRVCVSFLCLQLLLLKGLVYGICYLHVLFHPGVYGLDLNVLRLYVHLEVLCLYLVLFELVLLVLLVGVLPLEVKQPVCDCSVGQFDSRLEKTVSLAYPTSYSSYCLSWRCS